MIRSGPQIVSVAAVAIGIVLFGFTLYYIDLEETVANARRLGLALPIILLPGTCWQVLRTWGWAVAFPEDSRPPFTRLFRVRLAADAIGFFTVRGIASEPLKVLLLYDRMAPEVATAAVALERLAFAVIGIVIAALISLAAVTRLSMTDAWDTVFTLLIVGAVFVLALAALVARWRSGDYLGRLVKAINGVSGRRLEASRVIRFILDVEDVLLELVRGNRRRLVTLTGLAAVCYVLMAVEVWLVLWAVGAPSGCGGYDPSHPRHPGGGRGRDGGGWRQTWRGREARHSRRSRRVDGHLWMPMRITIRGRGRAVVFRAMIIDFAADWFDNHRLEGDSATPFLDSRVQRQPGGGPQ